MQFSKQAFWIVLPIVVQLVWKAKCNDTLIDEISWGSGHKTAKGLATQGKSGYGLAKRTVEVYLYRPGCPNEIRAEAYLDEVGALYQRHP